MCFWLRALYDELLSPWSIVHCVLSLFCRELIGRSSVPLPFRPEVSYNDLNPPAFSENTHFSFTRWLLIVGLTDLWFCFHYYFELLFYSLIKTNTLNLHRFGHFLIFALNWRFCPFVSLSRCFSPRCCYLVALELSPQSSATQIHSFIFLFPRGLSKSARWNPSLAVWYCEDRDHARQRCRQDHPSLQRRVIGNLVRVWV